MLPTYTTAYSSGGMEAVTLLDLLRVAHSKVCFLAGNLPIAGFG